MTRSKKDVLSEIQSLKILKEPIIPKINNHNTNNNKECDEITNPLFKQLKQYDKKLLFLEKELDILEEKND